MKRRRCPSSAGERCTSQSPLPALSEDEVVACLKQGGELTDRVSSLKSLLDRGFDQVSFESAQSSSECKGELQSRSAYYEMVLLGSDLLSRLSVDVYWILSCAGLLSFASYIESVEVTGVVAFIREDVMKYQFETRGTPDPEPVLSSILIDVVVFLFSQAYINSSSSLLRSKCLLILNQVVFANFNRCSLFDIYILNHILEILQLINDKSAVKTLQLEAMRRLICLQVEYQYGNSSAEGIFRSLLSHYDSEDILSTTISMIDTQDTIALDSFASETPSAASQLMVVVALEHLIDCKSSTSEQVAERLSAVCAENITEGFRRGVLRSVYLVEILSVTENFQGVPHSFFEALSRTEISTKGFTIFCQTLPKAITSLSEELLEAVSNFIESKRSNCPDLAENVLRVIRFRILKLSPLSRLFSGEINDKSTFEIQVKEWRAWVEYFQHTGELSEAVKCGIIKNRGENSGLWFRALTVIATLFPSLKMSCLDMLRLMEGKHFALLSPDAADRGNTSRDDTSEMHITAMTAELGVSGNTISNIKTITLITSEVLELIEANENFSSIEYGDQCFKKIGYSFRAALTSSLDSHVVSSCLCVQITLILDAAIAKYRNGEISTSKLWLSWSSKIFKACLAGNGLLETAQTAILLQQLDDAKESSSWRVAAALYCYDAPVSLL